MTILPDILEAERTYRLVETSPAAGYVTPKASITFSLSKGAKRLVFEKDSLTADAEGLLVDASYDTEARILSVTLKNDPTRIAITKTDYKTDALNDFEMTHKSAAAKKLWKRHKLQLFYYSLVCGKLFGQEPDEALIYSMPLGEALAEKQSFSQ